MSRIDRTAIFIELQNQKAHYQHLLKPRNTFKLDQNRLTITSHFRSRYYSESERNKKEGNKRILKNLKAINQQKGLLISMEEQYKKYLKKPQTQLKYRSNKAQKQITRANRIMLQKIIDAKPLVGQKQQWDKHYMQFKTQCKKLTKQTNYGQFYNINDTLRTTLNNLKHDEGKNIGDNQSPNSNQKKQKKKKRKFKKLVNVQQPEQNNTCQKVQTIKQNNYTEILMDKCQ